MNEIKYRVWDKKEKAWVSPGVIALLNNDTLLRFTGDRWVRNTGWREVSADGHVVQFSTGLFDRNGEEIYEGSVLRLDATGEYTVEGMVGVFVIEKELSSWGYEFSWKHISGYECPTHIMGDLNDKQLTQVEIIGNILENPELLK